MAEENFLINPPHKLRRKRKVIMRRRRRSNAANPWFGDSSGHRIAAQMRWGQIPRGKVSRHRKRRRVKARHRVVRRRIKHRVKHRRVVHRRVKHRVKHRRVVHGRGRRIDRRTKSYRIGRKKQYGQLKGFLALTSGPKRRFRYKSGAGWVKNPRRSSMRRRRRRKSNTWFGQPRRHAKASRKGWRRGHKGVFHAGHRGRRRRNAPAGLANPRRRRHHSRGRRRSRHGNPFGLSGGMVGQFTGTIMNVRHWAPLAITGGLSAITGAVVPGMVGVSGTWMKYGVQIGVAVGGGMVVEKVAGREHGQAWMIVGMAMVGYSLLKDYVLMPYFPQFAVGLGRYNDYNVDALEDVSQQVGAFPSMGAFPNMGGYPGVGEGDVVGAYPYDGAAY